MIGAQEQARVEVPSYSHNSVDSPLHDMLSFKT